MECFKKKLVCEFQERKKTLTTQVVRKFLLKKRREASLRGPRINIVRGVGQRIRGRRVYSHECIANLLINENRSPSSSFFLFFYTISHSFMIESRSFAQGRVVECSSCIVLHTFLV
jgi:hypothetical protein